MSFFLSVKVNEKFYEYQKTVRVRTVKTEDFYLEYQKHDFKEIVAYLSSKLNKGSWIYPVDVRRKLNVDIINVYRVLEICANKGVLSRYISVYCQKCGCYTYNYYSVLSEVPKKDYCLNCGNVIHFPVKHAVAIYKKI